VRDLRRWAVIAAALALAAEAPAAPAPKEELRALRARLERLQKEIARSEGSRSEAVDALRDVEVAISGASRRLQTLTAERQDVEARLEQLSDQMQALESRLQQQRGLAARLVYQHYTGAGAAGPLEFLLRADDLNSLARDRVYLEYVAQARKEALERLLADVEALQSLQQEALQRRSQIAVIEQREALESARLETERANRNQVLAKLAAEIERQRREAGALERDERRLAKVVEELARALAARKPARTAPGATPPEPRTGSAFERLKGRLHAPVRGQVVERFGTPRADSGLAWRGLFFRAPAGRDVKAVAAGRVVFADWLRGFGNLLILDHGDGFMSLYGNNESLVSQLGDPVRGGDTVATVGASGGSEATGLYFELRYQGRPFDPSAWLDLR
jgi:septal ring factor EnvC (AmiA/AmiB activator)